MRERPEVDSYPVRVSWAVYTSPELTQKHTETPNMPPSCGIVLVWATIDAEMRNGSVPGLDLRKGPPWSVMLLEIMFKPLIHAAAPGCDETCDPCGCM